MLGLFAGAIGKLLGIGDDEAFDWGGVIGAIVGVMLLLALYRAVAGERGGPPRRTV